MRVRFPFLRIAVSLAFLIGAACVTRASAEDVEDVEETEEEEEIVYELEAITVTGSRIQSEELLTPAPVTVLSRDEIKVRGLASIGDVLQTLTVQSNAINTQANNGGDGSTRISLRGLGAHRTLVLLNGRRFVPGGTGANSSVDLNAIPASAVERVEVLKDGASAVYGSDAVGGVVNIITRSETEGLEFEFYQGVSGEGDGESLDISVTAGLTSEKGSVLFTAGYHNRKPVWTGNRPFSTEDKTYDWEKNDGTYATSGSSATPEGHIIDQTGAPGNAAWQALAAAAGEAAGDFHRDPNAGWRPFNWAGNSSDGSGDLYNFQPENYLYTPQTRYTTFLSGSYEFAPEAKSFFEVSYTNRQSDQKLAPTPLFIISEGLAVSSTNIYNEFGRDFYDVRRRFVEAGNRNFLQDINTYRIVLGLEYPLPGFDTDLSYSYGRSEGTNINEGRFIRSNVARALGPDAECAAIGDCVPLDLLHGAGTITQEMLDYIQYTGIATGHSRQKILQWNLTGQIAKLPAGPLAVAAGISSRWEAGAYIPDPITKSGNTTGSKQESTEGAYSVRALYGETSVPVYRADAFGLDLTAAGRAFDYDTFGSGFTYEAGARCELPRGLTLRATISNAFRAPGIAEMFLGQSDAFPAVSDPCSVVDEAGSPRTLTAEQHETLRGRGRAGQFPGLTGAAESQGGRFYGPRPGNRGHDYCRSYLPARLSRQPGYCHQLLYQQNRGCDRGAARGSNSEQLLFTGYAFLLRPDRAGPEHESYYHDPNAGRQRRRNRDRRTGCRVRLHCRFPAGLPYRSHGDQHAPEIRSTGAVGKRAGTGQGKRVLRFRRISPVAPRGVGRSEPAARLFWPDLEVRGRLSGVRRRRLQGPVSRGRVGNAREPQGQLKQHVRSVRVLQIRNSDGRLRTYGRNQ